MIVDITKTKCTVTSSDPLFTGFPWISSGGWVMWEFDTPTNFTEASASFVGSPTLTLSGSYDTINWYPLGAPNAHGFMDFRDANGALMLQDATFLFFRLDVVGTDVRVVSITLLGDMTANSEKYLEVVSSTMFPKSYAEQYPFIPSTVKSFLRMLREPKQS